MAYFSRKPDWHVSEAALTTESVYRGRRQILRTLGFGALSLAGAGRLSASNLIPDTEAELRPTPGFELPGVRLTDYSAIISNNNFLEFSLGKKDVRRLANQGWKTRPWEIVIDGLVRHPLRMDIDQLLRRFGPVEQRNYRFRCVEAWSMVVPWDGIPLRKIIRAVEPASRARYVRFVSFFDPEVAPNQVQMAQHPWPYFEALRIDEANHDLSFLATGLYGRTLPNQNGAPIRLVVPWKYGYKSIKSITRIEFLEERPKTFWTKAQPGEYDFLANVDPHVPHARWSQATERPLVAGHRAPA